MAFVSLKEFLSGMGLATPEQFDAWNKAWRVAAASGSQESLLAFICRERGLAEDVFLQQLAKALSWPYLDLAKLNVAAEARNRISTKVAFQYSVLPTAVQRRHPAGRRQQSFRHRHAQRRAVRRPRPGPVRPGPQAPRSRRPSRNTTASAPKPSTRWPRTSPVGPGSAEDKEITEGDQEASVIKFVNQIIWEAFKDRATDIHFEPAEDELRIRYRIDGILHQTPMPPQLKRFQAAIISRIKVMSGMNISEKRLPQDGRINVRIKGEEIDIRVSTVPTVYGESVSLRLLTRGKIFLSLDKLGFSPLDEQAIREIIVKPHGIFLVTGPTGSGKSTSLYAFLSTINSVHKRIITDRGTGRIRAQGHQPDRGAPGDRPDLRHGPAPHPAPGPERDHGRRNPRPRDGRDRHPRRADRPLGLQHPAHQRRAQRLHPPDRHGHRAVPGRLLGRGHHGPAPGPHHLPALQGRSRRSSPITCAGSVSRRRRSTPRNSGMARAARIAASSATRAAWAFTNC